jgi:hypothetical protein
MFWPPIQKKGRRLEITAVYRPRSGVELLSEPREVFVEPRDPKELRFLRQVGKIDIPAAHKSEPAVGPFGDWMNSDWIRAVAPQVKPGELKDLLDLKLILKDIYAAAPKARAEGNRALLAWLRKRPDVKREALVAVVRGDAAHFKMSSTVEALDAAFPAAASKKEPRWERGTPPPSALKLSLRVYAVGKNNFRNMLTFGDPLYFEVALTNHGEKAVSGPAPSLAQGTLRFRVKDVDRPYLTKMIKAATEPAGGVLLVQVAPGETV